MRGEFLQRSGTEDTADMKDTISDAACVTV